MQIIFITVLFAAAIVGAFLLALTAVGGLQVSRKFQGGILQYSFYALFFSNSVAVMASGRNLEDVFRITTESVSPIASIAIRLTSFFVLLASLDQCIRFFVKNRKVEPLRALLMLAFAISWVGNVFLSHLFASHPESIAFSDAYILFFFVGLICLTPQGAEEALAAVRNSLIVYIAVGFLLIPIKPHLVLDSLYDQGYLPGVPRFAGLAPHAIVLGVNASVALWCLYAKPILNRRVNRLAWAICGVALFLSQAKAVWMAFALGMPVMWVCQNGMPRLNRKSIGQMKAAPVVLLSMAGTLLIALLFYIMSDAATTRLNRLLNSDEGAQLTSFTGRDTIWRLAMTEWRASPIFGYGQGVFGDEYRLEHHMEAATSGHSMIYDSLARAGGVGFGTLLIFICILVYAGIKFGKATRGISAALALSLVVRSVSEVPINFSSLGVTDTPVYLLLAMVAIGFSMQRTETKKADARMQFDRPTVFAKPAGVVMRDAVE